LKLLKFLIGFLVGLYFWLNLGALASPQTSILYDAFQKEETIGNSSPRWLVYTNTGGKQSWQNSPPGTSLDTLRELSIMDGFTNYAELANTNPDFPPLDRTTGFKLSFRLAIEQEKHLRPERAGFSVILLSNDVGKTKTTSVEIGFQKDRIFLQNDQPLFGLQAAQETTNFNPVGVGAVDYEITVQNSNYTLAANRKTLLEGKLRDYSNFVGLLNPYNLPNFIFFGDDTTSAGAKILLEKISLQIL
jgi:hypothetical protein